MNRRFLNNEKGLTLVELLGALSLFLIVIVLVSTVIMQLVSSEEKASEQILLRQHTNVLISDLRKQYDEGKDTLCFNNEEKQFENINVHINGTERTIGNDGCIDINNKQSLSINLTTKNNIGEEFTIETIFTEKKDSHFTVRTESNQSDDFDTKEDFENIVNDEKDYTDGIVGECNYTGNTRFPESVIMPSNGRDCKVTTVQDGNTWYPNGLTINDALVHVDNDLFIDGSLRFDRNAEVISQNNVRIEGPITLVPGSMKVNNLYALDSLTLENHSTFQTYGSARINGLLTIKSSSNLSIGRNLFSLNRAQFQENTVTNIGKNAIFENDLTLVGNARLEIDGDLSAFNKVHFQENTSTYVVKNATFEDEFILMGRAELRIGGNGIFRGPVNMQNDAKIIIEGDAHFAAPVGYNWSSGTICVKGNALFDSNVGSNLNIIENAGSCN